MTALTDTAQRFVARLPVHYGGLDDPDPIVARWQQATANEADRIRELLYAIRDTTIPSRADDTVGALSRWEAALTLPVAPAGVTVEQRRSKVVAALRGRRTALGRDWRSAITAAMGTDQWNVYANTPDPYTLTVEIPYVEGSYSAGQVEALIRRRAPANLVILMRYSQGFIVGASRVGDAI